MASPIENALQLGFRFDPKPRDAVTYYLPRLIAGEPMHAAIRPFVHATDIYAREPGALAARFRPTPKAGHRFFFSSFKRQPGSSGRGVRAAGRGHWHTQGHSTDVLDDAGVKLGEAKKFRYKTADKQFTDWLMDEFSSCSEESVVGDRQYVLCKIYVSPKASPDSVAHQESDAFAFAPPPPLVEEPAAAAPNSNKRPPPPVAEPPCPKRIRAAAVVPIPTPPMVKPPSPLPVQAPAPHPPRQSIQASTAAPPPCSMAAARDPFCTETEPPAAAGQELDDDLNYYFDFDADFAKSLEGSLEFLTTEQAQEEVPAQAQDDDDDLDFTKSLEASLETKPVEEEAPADEAQDDDDDLDLAKSLEASLETKPVEEEAPADEAQDSLEASLETKPVEEEAPADEAQDDDVDLDFAKSLEDSLETEPAGEEEADDWFAPFM